MLSSVKKPVTVLLIFSLVFLAACKNESGQGGEDPSDIKVSWQLITNFADSGSNHLARFVMTNNGNEVLGETGWNMYFSITPRTILPDLKPQPATVSHINGDWYKLSPNKGFELRPGDSIEIVYHANYWATKITDAPLGLYIVLDAKAGKQERILPLGDARIIPFTSAEQILRGSNDKEPLQSAGLNYTKNLPLSILPKDKTLPFIPEPFRYAYGADSFRITAATKIIAEAGLEKEADFLREKLERITGKSIKVETGTAGDGNIILKRSPMFVNGISKEAYRILVDKSIVLISGSDAAGVFYGIQSLLALLPLEANASVASALSIRAISIEDAPRFGFRSVHLDVARNFQTKETVMKTLDILASYKLNHLLLYAIEDEGWRVEINGLPELTGVGSHRQHLANKEVAALHPAYGSGGLADDPSSKGTGFYSRADYVEILRYANSRHIKIIPFINFPGHARAAIKSMEARYQRLMKEGKQAEAEEYRLFDPEDHSQYISAQGYQDNVVDITRPSVYHFFEKVVDEFMGMYKEAGLTLDVLNIGGDEVPSGAWEKSTTAKAYYDKHPEMETYKNFHSYLTERILPILKKRNIAAHGWEEAALWYKADGSTVPNKAYTGGQLVPYIWNNVFDPGLGYRLANAGYPIVLCSVTNFYFDMAYNNSPVEPGLYWGGYVDMRDAFTYDPFNVYNTTYTNAMGIPMDFSKAERLDPSARKNIIGVQAQLFGESIKGPAMLEYALLPKLFGYAQSAWCASRAWENVQDNIVREQIIQDKWNIFANTVSRKDLPRLSYLNGGYNYRVPPPGAVLENGELKANAALPGLFIRFTTDGTDPVNTSALYEAPVKLSGKIKLRCFDAAGKGSSVVEP